MTTEDKQEKAMLFSAWTDDADTAKFSAYTVARAFTPVCTTEMMTFASMQDRFTASNAVLLGLSIDSNPSHIEWTRRMEHYSWNGIEHPVLKFPIVADDMGSVAKMYGMLMPSASSTRTVRNVFIIDPKGIVRAILIYPLTTGRNIDEIYRLLLALQAYDSTGNATPADWEPGDSQILPVPGTVPMSNQRLEDQKSGGYSCIDWYLCLTKPSGANQSTQTHVAPAAAVTPAASSAMSSGMTSPMRNMTSGTIQSTTGMPSGNMSAGNMPDLGMRYPEINYSNRPFVDNMNENMQPQQSMPMSGTMPGTMPAAGGQTPGQSSIMDENRSFFGRYR